MHQLNLNTLTTQYYTLTISMIISTMKNNPWEIKTSELGF